MFYEKNYDEHQKQHKMKTKKIIGVLGIAFIVVIASFTMLKSEETIVISRTSTQSYLDSLTMNLDSKGIELELNKVAFNDQGHLQAVSGEIHFNRFSYGTFVTDNLDKIVIESGFAWLSIDVNQAD